MKKIAKYGLMAMLVLVGLPAAATQGLKWYLAPPVITDLQVNKIKGNDIASGIGQRPKDNKYVQYDLKCLKVMQLFNGDKQYFTQNSSFFDFNQHLSTVEFKAIPEFESADTYKIFAKTLAGDMNPAIHVVHWSGKNAPTIIYHHGGSVVPEDENFKHIFPPGTRDNLNLMIIRAPYHKKSSTEIMEAGADINKYMAMMATSVKLTEDVIQTLRIKGYHNFQVSGVSLGGFITNRHHLAYNSADSYVPIIAGTAQGDLFFSSIENSLVSDNLQQVKDKVLDLLNFNEAWQMRDHSNVYPVLAQYDCINYIEIMGPSYGDISIDVLNVGHLTAINSTEYLREKMLNSLAL